MLLAVLVGACGSASRRSPFLDGPPSTSAQDLILNECGNPTDTRRPGSKDNLGETVGSSLGKQRPSCEAHLSWLTGNGRITVVEIVGYGDAAWVKRFAEAAVLPLLKDEAQDFIRARLIYKLDGKQAIKEQVKMLQGEISIEMTVDPIGSGFTSARLRVVR